MKISKLFLLVLIAAGLMTSCVKDDDFSIPETSITPPEIDGQVLSISAVKDILASQGNGATSYTFEDADKYMTGYVVSSDESGNFYQVMVLQDKPENPTAGIKIMIAANPLYTKYEIGRKVYVKLQGFTIGESNGLVALGIPVPGSSYLDEAPQAFINKIIRDTVKATIVPLEISIGDFGPQYEDIYIKLDSVEFPANLVLGSDPATFAAEPGDQYDASRTIESCDGQSTQLLTSTFSDFKALTLPAKMGSISGILQKTFNGSSYVIKINTPTAIEFTKERCDGNGGGDGGNPGNPGTADLPFFEDFEGQLAGTGANVNISGWINVNTNGGQRVWEVREFDSNQYAQTSAFSSNEDPYEAWLVTPGINLPNGSTAQLNFDTNDGYYNGAALTVYVSTDFTGDPSTATWTQFNNVTLAQGDSSGYGTSFVNSGNVDLTAYAGQTVYIGFRYQGSNSGVTSTYQIDNISVSEDGSGGGDGGGGNQGGTPTPPSGSAIPAFAGANFETWQDFLDGLNQFGIQTYATQSAGTGMDASASLHILTDPSTTDGNDYVFTSLATSDLPATYSKIHFYMKGTADKSVSINIYKADGTYYRFNLGQINGDAVVEPAESNQYANGSIDTGGNWVLVELDLSGITDLNTTDTSGDFFALKIGKAANYDLQFDNFTIE